MLSQINERAGWGLGWTQRPWREERLPRVELDKTVYSGHLWLVLFFGFWHDLVKTIHPAIYTACCFMCQQVGQGRNTFGNPIVSVPLSSISCLHTQLQHLSNTPYCPRSKLRPIRPPSPSCGTIITPGLDSSPGPQQTYPDCCSHSGDNHCLKNMFTRTSWWQSPNINGTIKPSWHG